ncbi:MAG TPA: LuxR C-terminal-related transcriptional regulator [Gammaproteobacteria bacterium]|nr:LuxR C-terminal-related transcriptional regulator [Gammaproteobacteria bacterium]
MKYWSWLKDLFSKKEISQKQKNSGNVYSFFGTADANVNMPNINAKDSTIIINTYHQSNAITQSKERESVKNPSASVNIEKSPFDKLFEFELQIIMMIVKGGGIQTIAEELSTSGKTIRSYMYRIFEKLDIQSDVELTLLALKHGLI